MQQGTQIVAVGPAFGDEYDVVAADARRFDGDDSLRFELRAIVERGWNLDHVRISHTWDRREDRLVPMPMDQRPRVDPRIDAGGRLGSIAHPGVEVVQQSSQNGPAINRIEQVVVLAALRWILG